MDGGEPAALRGDAQDTEGHVSVVRGRGLRVQTLRVPERRQEKRSQRGKNAEDGSTEDGATEDGSTECLSLCLESKEIDTISGDKVGALSARTAALGAGAGGAGQARVSKVAGGRRARRGFGVAASRSCWLVFRVTAAHQADGKKSVHRDSYGRFAGDALGGDTTSLGWNDFMPMATFAGGTT